MKKRPTLFSYRLRVSLAMALFAIIPFSIMGMHFINAEKTKMEETALAQYTQVLEVKREQLNRSFQEMENKVLYVKNSTSIRSSLNRLSKLNLVEKLEFVFELQEAEKAVSTGQEELSLRWYSDLYDHNYGGYCYSREDLAAAYADRPEELQKIYDLESNETLLLLRDLQSGAGGQAVSVYTKIASTRDSGYVLEMTMPINAADFHVQVELPASSFVGAQLVLNGEPQIIVLQGNGKNDRAKLEEFYAPGKCQGYYPLDITMPELGESRITCMLQEKYVYDMFRASITQMVVIFAVLVLAVLACSYVTSRLLSQRVIRFIERVDCELESGTQKIEQPKKIDAEFSDIEQRIRELAYCSREYGEQLKAYEVEKKQMELELLQMRFNPHFLYNTLGSIRYQVKEPRIRKSIDSLIAYYRIVLSKGSLLISIASEIQMIQEYLNLQTFAFDLQNVQVVYEIEEDVKQYTIVKHLLQPIVENALEHGVRGAENGGTITIRARLQGDDVVFEVEDTGVGMTPEHIGLVTSKPCAGLQGGGYGVYNVIQRIKTYYGPEYGIEFFSVLGKGTRVILTIPRRNDIDQKKSD